MAKKEKGTKTYADMEKDEIICAEIKKLSAIFEKLEDKTKKSVGSLVEEAAFMGASLYQLRKIINEKGYTEEYQNGANQSGIKKCSEIEIYNVMIKNYMSIIKQLTDLIPKAEGGKPENDGFEKFANGRDED